MSQKEATEKPANRMDLMSEEFQKLAREKMVGYPEQRAHVIALFFKAAAIAGDAGGWAERTARSMLAACVELGAAGEESVQDLAEYVRRRGEPLPSEPVLELHIRPTPQSAAVLVNGVPVGMVQKLVIDLDADAGTPTGFAHVTHLNAAGDENVKLLRSIPWLQVHVADLRAEVEGGRIRVLEASDRPVVPIAPAPREEEHRATIFRELLDVAAAVRVHVPASTAKIEQPSDPLGRWFVEFKAPGKAVQLEFRPGAGFAAAGLQPEGYWERSGPVMLLATRAVTRVASLLGYVDPDAERADR